MPGFVDIHAHLLPGIDDGPADLRQSLALARAAAATGTEVMAATPHLRSDFPEVDVWEIAAECERLRGALARELVPLRVVSGAEVSLAWALEAGDEELRLASYGQRGADLLIETPTSRTAGLEALLYQVRLRGYRVTLAHPERGEDFQRDFEKLGSLVEQGVLLQINAASLRVSRRAAANERLAMRLCISGVAHAIASDGHRAASWRPVTELAKAALTASRLVGPAGARRLTVDGPAAILAGEAVPAPPSAAPQSPAGRRLRRR